MKRNVGWFVLVVSILAIIGCDDGSTSFLRDRTDSPSGDDGSIFTPTTDGDGGASDTVAPSDGRSNPSGSARTAGAAAPRAKDVELKIHDMDIVCTANSACENAQVIRAKNCGDEGCAFEVDGLPAGLQLVDTSNPNRKKISGTPTVVGTSTVAITVSKISDPSNEAEGSFTIRVDAMSLPTLELRAVSVQLMPINVSSREPADPESSDTDGLTSLGSVGRKEGPPVHLRCEAGWGMTGVVVYEDPLLDSIEVLCSPLGFSSEQTSGGSAGASVGTRHAGGRSDAVLVGWYIVEAIYADHVHNPGQGLASISAFWRRPGSSPIQDIKDDIYQSDNDNLYSVGSGYPFSKSCPVGLAIKDIAVYTVWGSGTGMLIGIESFCGSI